MEHFDGYQQNGSHFDNERGPSLTMEALQAHNDPRQLSRTNSCAVDDVMQYKPESFQETQFQQEHHQQTLSFQEQCQNDHLLSSHFQQPPPPHGHHEDREQNRVNSCTYEKLLENTIYRSLNEQGRADYDQTILVRQMGNESTNTPSDGTCMLQATVRRSLASEQLPIQDEIHHKSPFALTSQQVRTAREKAFSRMGLCLTGSPSYDETQASRPVTPSTDGYQFIPSQMEMLDRAQRSQEQINQQQRHQDQKYINQQHGQQQQQQQQQYGDHPREHFLPPQHHQQQQVQSESRDVHRQQSFYDPYQTHFVPRHEQKFEPEYYQSQPHRGHPFPQNLHIPLPHQQRSRFASHSDGHTSNESPSHINISTENQSVVSSLTANSSSPRYTQCVEEVQWICSVCTLMNVAAYLSCAACGETRKPQIGVY